MQIRILVTGGTFDKEYNEIEEKLEFKDTHISQVLKQGRCELPITIRNIMMVDSWDMTDEDRQLILNQCKRCEEKKIVITHGTSTMEKTANFLAQNLTDKTIILTGAMIPYHYGSSDGLFNLGCALAFVQSLPQGVYLAMNGRFFSAGKVKKDHQTGKFEGKEENIEQQDSF